jgi:S-(hydroxymethyl)glutathione dehydrogenase / alcohol dehydrogenase
MRAAVCREFGAPLVIEELSLDPPGRDEVHVKLAACAICHSDITYMDGGWGGTLPAVYGHEASGVVETVGPGVEDLAPGDHVLVTLIRSCGHCFHCAQGDQHICETQFPLDREGKLHDGTGAPVLQALRTGGFAEEVVVERSQVAAIPNDVPFDSASLLSCGVITGLGAVVNTARVPQGASVVVIGTGGVGLNSIQGAAISGAFPIIAVDLDDRKIEAAQTFGATHGVNPKAEDVVARVREITGGRGADYAFVTVGTSRAAEQAVGLIRKGGTMVMVGIPPTGDMASLEIGNVANDSQVILGSKMGSTRLAVDIPKLVALYQEGRLKLDELISGRYPLDEINAAIASVKRGEALRNVIVF